MRWICATMVTVTVTVALAAGTALAEADGPDHLRVTGLSEDAVLVLRAGPEADAPEVGTVPGSATGLRAYGCVGGLSLAEWQQASEAERAAAAAARRCLVRHGRLTGWAEGQYLGEGAASAEPSGAWRIVRVGGAPALGAAEILFAPDGGIGGGTGCNRFRGRGRVVEGRLELEPTLAMTMMACHGPLAAQETAVLSALAEPMRLRYDPAYGELTLSPEGAGPALLLAPAE